MSADPLTATLITIALTAGQYALSASQKIKGPRLDDLNADVASYGSPIPRLWGIRRLACQTIHAEKLKEKKKTSKSAKGGGKMTEYKYFGTWAGLITDVEIDSVLRILMDKRVVYDSGALGPIGPVLGLVDGPFGIPIKLGTGQNLRIYLGTQDQLPDPRYSAWCEDRYGVGTATAFRGSAYLFFEDVPLEKFGNRIPQVEVEVIRTKVPSFPFEQHSGANGGISAISADGSLLYQLAGNDLSVWDLPSRQLMVRRTLPGGGMSARFGLYYDPLGAGADRIFMLSGVLSPVTIWAFGTDGSGGESFTMTGPGAWGGLSCKSGMLFAYPVNTNEEYQGYAGTGIVLGGSISQYFCGFSPTHYFADADGVNAWSVGTQIGDNNLGIARAPGSSSTIISTTGGGAVGMDNGAGQLLVAHAGQLMLIDKATLAVVDSVAFFASFGIAFLDFDSVQPGSREIWIGQTKFDTRTLAILETMNPGDWVVETTPFAGGAVHSPILDATVSVPLGADTLTIRYLHRVDSAGSLLSVIAQDVSDWSNVQGVDVSKLTQVVPGYSTTQGTGRAMLDPLLAIHDVDARPHDFIVDFLPRGSAPAGSLTMARYARDGDRPRYSASKKQGADLPKMITISFADIARDQQRNSVISPRSPEATRSTREDVIDMSTYASDVDGAQRLCDRYFRRIWNSRDEASLILTAQRLGLEPGDVWTVPLDDVEMDMRLDKMTVRGLALDCDFVRDETSISGLNNAAGPPMAGTDPTSVFVPSPTVGFALDTPLISDADNNVNPLIYPAAGPYLTPWAGATMFRGDDGTFDDTFASFDSSDGATWGFCVTVLAAANPNLPDRGNSVDVVVYNGTLTSKTEAQLKADPALNLMAIGADGRWEYLQFATATLTGTSGTGNAYTLTGFRRGRRGTEGSVGLNQAGDRLILLSTVAEPVQLGLDEVGASMAFKAASVGRDPDGAATIAFVYAGATLKPYAPCQVRARRNSGTGDWVFTWVRRTRIGGIWASSGGSIPLGEASEAYELAIPLGGGVFRTISAATPTATWTAAQQTTDLGAPQTSLPADVTVYQLSDSVGRGFASPEPLAA